MALTAQTFCAAGLTALMLVSLDIRDVLIIDHLELAFQPGLNVLTGETGAGQVHLA